MMHTNERERPDFLMLCLKADLDRFLDALEDFQNRFSLRGAAPDVRNFRDVDAIFVLLDEDGEVGDLLLHEGDEGAPLI